MKLRPIHLALLVVLALSLAVLVYVLAYLPVFPWNPEDLIRHDAPRAADAIVILADDPHRIDRGLDLVVAGYADHLFYPRGSPWALGELERRAQLRGLRLVTEEGAQDGPKDGPEAGGRPVTLDYGPTTDSTYAEALNTLAWVRSRERAGRPVERLLVVTSDYHSHRTGWTFRTVLPGAVDLRVIAADSHYKPSDALVDGTESHRLFKSEQQKFIGYYFLFGWRPGHGATIR